MTFALIAILAIWALLCCRATRSTPVRMAIAAFAAFHAAILFGSLAQPEPAGGDALTLASTLFAAAILPVSLVALFATKAIAWALSRVRRPRPA